MSDEHDDGGRGGGGRGGAGDDPEEARLRELFAEMRAADEARAPGFAGMTARARARKRERSGTLLWIGAGGGVLAMAAVVMLAVGVLTMTRGSDSASSPVQSAEPSGDRLGLRGLDEPEPLAFLLERPGGVR